MTHASPPAAHEIELKLRVPPDRLAALAEDRALAARALGPARRQRLVSVYFDTADGRLRRRGLALRVRRIGRRRVQTLKAEGDSLGAVAVRPEHEVAIEGDVPDPTAFPAPEARELLGLVLPGELAPVFATRIERTLLTVAWPGPERPEAVVEVALDLGRIEAGDRVQPVSELELELVRGPVAALAALVEELRPLAPLAVETQDKATRGWALAAGHAPAPIKAGRIRLEPAATVADAFARIGLSCLGHALANLVPAAAGSDPEGVHQLRVALRRLRSALSLFRPVLGEEDRGRLAGELRWLLGELGPARDRDVLEGDLLVPLAEAEGLEPELGELRRVLAERKPSLAARVEAAVTSRRTAELMLDLMAWFELQRFRASAPQEVRAVLDGPIAPFAADVLERRWRKARKLGRRFDELDPPGRHALRIALKKLRYGVEFLGSLWDADATRRFASRLAELQDRLGHLNDVAVCRDLARGLLAELASDARIPAVALALGAVTGWHARGTPKLLRETRERWAELAEARPFWRADP